MDFNSLSSNPMLKNSMKKFKIFLAIYLVLEIGAFVGVGFLIGGDYAAWLTVGVMLVGYAIKPNQSVKQAVSQGAPAFSVRRVVSTLLMIPGFLTDIVAILVLIAPVRRGLQQFVLRKVLPPSLSAMLGGGGNPFASMGNMGGMNMNDLLHNMNTAKAQTSSRDEGEKRDPFKREPRTEKTRTHGDVIDIDYEVTNGKKAETVVEIDRTTRPQSVSPKAIEADEVLDVPYEWHQ